ncbi:MAG: SRPBCC family protein [Methyloglobulus sp.]
MLPRHSRFADGGVVEPRRNHERGNMPRPADVMVPNAYLLNPLISYTTQEDTDMNRFILLTITLLLCNSAVFAHGPVRQKMDRTIEVNAPATAVWKIIGNFADLFWLPMVDSVKADAGNNIGSSRVINLIKNGGTIKEKLIEYDATEMSYK